MSARPTRHPSNIREATSNMFAEVKQSSTQTYLYIKVSKMSQHHAKSNFAKHCKSQTSGCLTYLHTCED